jgi:hypothetical protein
MIQHPLGFVEVEPSAEIEYTPWSNFADMDENSAQGGLSDLIASLEERFASGRGNSSHRNEHLLPSRKEDLLTIDPALATSIENVIRLPTEEDYPLWRLRCQVKLFCTI